MSVAESDDEVLEEENVDVGEGENGSDDSGQYYDKTPEVTMAQVGEGETAMQSQIASGSYCSRQTARRGRPFASNTFVTVSTRGRVVRRPDVYQ